MGQMKLSKKNNDIQSAIRRALAFGTPLGSLLVGLAAQSNAAQDTKDMALSGEIRSVATNAVNETKVTQPVVMGKMRITPRPLAGVPMKLPCKPTVPEGKYYVKAGDTLTKIASEYKTTVAELKRLNGFDDERANRIKVGEVINVAEPKK